ncbi:PrsW family intramembrane metalloprotease [Salinirubellus sp. GCM10025818]|uniref:PrsW family intramembrane metalloprotease n=1 Tax=Salinirubellus TaxID=2162630 RepID=UPI0030D0A653
MTKRDPVDARSDGDVDLYDISTWEPRSRVDRLSAWLYNAGVTVARFIFILVALLIIAAQVLLGGIGATVVDQPVAVWLVALSVVPALALVWYVYRADVTDREPLGLLVGTFVLGVLFAGFAAIINSLLQPALQIVPVIGMVLFFYLVVGPVEETVKWLAIRLLPYRYDSFNAVVDGAVYGAAAGLGFATIENALYITRELGASPTGTESTAMLGAAGLGAVAVAQLGGLEVLGNIIGSGGQITAFRALAGPGHVIYSAFAGYYLGLAKFNPDRAGPIIVKGLLIAAFIHATYNTLVGIVPGLAVYFLGVPAILAFLAFVIVYDGILGYFLYRKLKRYRAAYHEAHADEVDGSTLRPERTEFDA